MIKVQRQPFGTLGDGREAELFTITNSSGASASFTNFGAAVVGVLVPDRHGRLSDVVLGYDSVEAYEQYDRCAGATCGRFAGRIGGGAFWLGDEHYEVSRNENQIHCLHGGFEGFDRKLWDAEVAGETVKFTYFSRHGEDGFPGNLQMEIVCSFNEENEVKLCYHGVSDKDTVVNLTNHVYFNLAGHGAGNVGDHQVKIPADFYVPCDGTPMPNGEIRKVEDTPMDLRNGVYLRDYWETEFKQIACLGGFNHDFVLNRQARKTSVLAGTIWEEQSGRRLDVYTTKPAVHFFTANNLTRRTGKENAVYQVHGGFCMEPQFFSNSMQYLHFPSPELKAGEAYLHETRFCFSVL